MEQAALKKMRTKQIAVSNLIVCIMIVAFLSYFKCLTFDLHISFFV